jgi:hypothetical protein
VHRRKLTASEARFAQFYVTSRNGSDSARRAGYSPKGAHVAAIRLLKRDRVQEEMAKLLLYRPGGAARVTCPDEVEVTFHDGKSPGQLLEERSQRIAAELSREWIMSVLIGNERMRGRNMSRSKRSKRSWVARMLEKPTNRAQRVRRGRGR